MDARASGRRDTIPPLPGFFTSRFRRLSDDEALLVLEHWRRQLDVQCEVTLEHISRFQVVGPDGAPGAELVGVVTGGSAATIYHTRALTAEDIVHELLHVAHVHWSEDVVVSETAHVLALARRRAVSGSRAPNSSVYLAPFAIGAA